MTRVTLLLLLAAAWVCLCAIDHLRAGDGAAAEAQAYRTLLGKGAKIQDIRLPQVNEPYIMAVLYYSKVDDADLGLLRHIKHLKVLHLSDNGRSADGSLFAIRRNHDTAEVFDTKTGKSLTTLSGNIEGIRCLDFSPDGMLLAIGCEGLSSKAQRTKGRVRVWNLKTSKMVAELD